MPKDPWTYKRRKRRSKGKGQQSALNEPPLLPDPDEPSTSAGPNSEMSLDSPLKIEEKPEIDFSYPDIRFPKSTTLFPAEGIEIKSVQSSNCREVIKRMAENKFSTSHKKAKVSDSTKTEKETFSDDCVVIENSPQKVKVEVIDLTDDCMILEPLPKKVKIEVVDLTDESQTIAPILCSPVRACFLQNMTPNPPLDANGDIRVKIEPEEKTFQINTNGELNCGIQEKSKENKASNYADSMIHNISLRSELGLGNGENKGVDGQVLVTNTVSVCVVQNATDSRISDNLCSDVPIKLEQDGNCLVGDNSTPASNISPNVYQTSVNSINPPVISEPNNIKKPCEVIANYMPVSSPSVTFCTRIPPDIPFETENLFNAIDKGPKEKVKDWLASCSVNNDEAQENVVSNEVTKGTGLSHMLNTDNVKKEQCEDGVMSSETLISNDLNRTNMSPFSHSGISSVDLHLHQTGSFPTPLLKYLNLNTKVDLLDISRALTYLNHMINIQENVVVGPKCSDTPNNLRLEKKKNPLEELLSNDILRQILDRAKPIQSNMLDPS